MRPNEDWLEELIREGATHLPPFRYEPCPDGKFSLGQILHIISSETEEESGLEAHMHECETCINNYAYLFDAWKDGCFKKGFVVKIPKGEKLQAYF